MRLAVLSTLALVSTTSAIIPDGCQQHNFGNEDKQTCIYSGMQVDYYVIIKEAKIMCKDKVLDCGKLPKLTFARGKPMNKLVIESCALNSSLECVLPAFNATGLSGSIEIKKPKTAVTKETLRGLDVKNATFQYFSDVQTPFSWEAMQLFPNLHGLWLRSVGLAAIAPHTFSSTPSLDSLEISLHNITSLPEDAFNGLSNLTKLDIFENHFQKVHPNAFKGLVSVERIDLSKNDISALPVGVFRHSPHLTVLKVTRDKGAFHLQEGVISGLSHLKELVLQSSKLELDPRSLSGLPALQTLDLQYSAISELPADLFHNSTSIVRMLLKNNNLRWLPETLFEGLEKLQMLALSSNKLEKVTGNMFQSLVGLREIYLDENLIEVLPESLFSTLSHLETVSIFNNRIRTIHGSSFASASSVKSLNLSGNRLSWDCISGGSPLNTLTNLTKLDLSHNKIRRVCSDWTTNMTKLRELNLAYNNLTEVTKTDVQFSSLNITVNLQYNQISTLEPNNYIVHHPTLLLEHNPFHCDCQLYEFLRQLQSGRSPYRVGDATCRDATMNGSSLYSSEGGASVSLDDLTCLLNDTTQGCTCVSRPAKNRMECNCKTLNSTSLPNPAHYNGGISKMMLTLGSIQKEGLEGLPSFVNQLNLPHLELETVPDIPETVTHVDLSYNKLSRVPLEILSRRNLTLELRNNPLNCGCFSIRDISNLLNNLTKVTKHRENMTCDYGARIEQVGWPCYQFTGVSFVVVGLLFVTITLAYKYSPEIVVWLYNNGFKRIIRDEWLDAKKKYDVFVSFAHEDKVFLKETLMPILDNKYKVCVHDRDWIIGDTIVDQIYKSVAESRRTLIVLSKDYLKSDWAMQELSAAYKQAAADKRPRAVVILRDSVKDEEVPEGIKAYLDLTTYVKWGEERFWERLYEALPRKLKAEDLRKRKKSTHAVNNLGGELHAVNNEEVKLVYTADLSMANAADLRIINTTESQSVV